MLLERLIQRQRELGETDAAFAQRLGISRQLWQFTRTGRQRIGEAILQGATRAFPDLQPLVLLFLQQDASQLSTTASNNTLGSRGGE